MIRYFNVSMLKKIMFIGLPFAAEQMFFNGGEILTQVFIVSLGTYAIATNAISSSLAGVFQIPSAALTLTTITVVGQCMGRRNIEDARKFTKSFLWLSSFSFVLMGLIIIPMFRPLVSLFHPPAEIDSLSAFAEADGTRVSSYHLNCFPPTCVGGFFISTATRIGK